jgi:plasmid stability protein
VRTTAFIKSPFWALADQRPLEDPFRHLTHCCVEPIPTAAPPAASKASLARSMSASHLLYSLDVCAGNCESVDVKNITVSVDDEVHRKARIRAAELGTSVSAVVREFLIRFAGGETDFERRKKIQDRTIASIESFRAADRLPREDVHRRDAVR